MASSTSELKAYYEEGKKQKKAYMIIWCDAFEHEDYPEYFDTREEAVAASKTGNERNMKRFMEAYDLAVPFHKQPGMTNGKGRANCLANAEETNNKDKKFIDTEKKKLKRPESITDVVAIWFDMGVAKDYEILAVGIREVDWALVPCFFNNREEAQNLVNINSSRLPFDMLVASYDLKGSKAIQLAGNLCNTLSFPPS